MQIKCKDKSLYFVYRDEDACEASVFAKLGLFRSIACYGGYYNALRII